MALVPLTFPPGVYRNGTDNQAKGRFRDSNLVRWVDGTLRPMGGWELHTAALPANAPARSIISWVDTDAARWAAVGTHNGLYAMTRTGACYPITPAGLVPGNAGAVVGGGYGFGDYGKLGFGVPGADPGLVDDCTVWSLDTFGENLVACNADDGKIYKWERNTGTPAQALSGAPQNNRALVVTEEGFLFALGAGGDPRLVQWADQQSDSDWTPSATRQAGSFPLQTTGRVMCGKRIRGGTLLFTDQDVYLATYQGPPLIYGFERVGAGCGVISQGAAVVGGDAVVAWMSRSGFWTYDGAARPLPCEVSDYVFSDLNRVQASRISSFHSPTYGEITWLYPSATSSECDRYVRWNYRENHWAIGRMARTCGVGEGVYPYPLLVGADGKAWRHETGFAYGGDEPYAETGPIEIGNGDRVYTALALIPDENTVGDVEAVFFGKYLPTEDEVQWGPYAPNTRTDIRFSARQARMRLTGARAADWRIGAFKLDISMRGLR